MSKKVCGNCEHFAHEPNTPSRGVCWHSAEFDYYAVRGEHWAGCDDWMERVTPEIVMCMGRAKEEQMSAIEYTKCDNPDCGRVTPDSPDEIVYYSSLGWARLVAGESYDLCPDCAEKAKKAVGLA